MTEFQVFQHVPHSRLVALGVIDGLARALHTAGDVPPPLGDIRCQIVRQTVPLVRTFDPPLILWTLRNPTGFVLLDGTYVHEDARAVRRPLGAGTYVIRVRGPYYEDREFSLDWPPAEVRIPLNQPGKPDNIELLPGAAYPLPDVTVTRFQLGPTIIRGSLFTSAGDPIAGLPVEVINLPPFLQPPELPPLLLADWPFLKSTSNRNGDWVVVLPGRRYLDAAPEIPAVLNPPPPAMTKQFTIRFGDPNTGPVTIRQRIIELGSEVSVNNTALRGQVVGPRGAPIANVQITTSIGPETSMSRANGLWFLYFDLDQPTVNSVTVTVTTPDGASASDSTARVQSRATVVVPTFHFS